jgi:hypothetical protein
MEVVVHFVPTADVLSDKRVIKNVLSYMKFELLTADVSDRGPNAGGNSFYRSDGNTVPYDT